MKLPSGSCSPSEGRVASAFAPTSPPSRLPLSRLVSLQSVVCTEVAGSSGSPLPSQSPRFRRADGFPSAPSPALVRARVHPLVGVTSTSEFVFACHLPTVVGNLPWGSLLLSDINVRSPLDDGVPKSRLRSDLSVSRALVGLLLRSPRGFVSSRSHSRGSRFRGLPRYSAAPPVDGRCPPVVGLAFLPGSKLPGASRRGLAFRAFLRASIRCQNRAVKRCPGPIPSYVSAPSGVSPRAVEMPSHPLRSWPLHRTARCPIRRDLQRIASARPRSTVPSPATRTSFVAVHPDTSVELARHPVTELEILPLPPPGAML